MIVPKAVVFDLGKVLLDFDYGIAIRRLVANSSLSLQDLHQMLDQSPLLYDYETGLLSTEDFFAQVRATSGFRGNLKEFASVFADIFSEITPMVTLHGDLHQRGVPTYLFSNTNDLAIRHIRRRFPFFSKFSGYVLSYEHRCMKPAAGLYQAVERLSKLRGAELFYLDDRPENVATARKRGWRTVVHETPEKSRRSLARAGLLG